MANIKLTMTPEQLGFIARNLEHDTGMHKLIDELYNLANEAKFASENVRSLNATLKSGTDYYS